MLQRLHVPLLKAEDIIPHLAKREQHWKDGYSAKMLADTWYRANGIPVSVQKVFKSCAELGSVDLIDGVFEKEVDLRTPGRNSQTDLMAVVTFGDQLGVIAVEGKVDESFGQLISEWNDESPGKQRRLKSLCSTLSLDADRIGGVRYQLLHRSASAVYEAQRYKSRHAMMLVHSFSPVKSSFDDFHLFSQLIGIPVSRPNTISSTKVLDGINLRLGWVSE